MMDDKIGLAKRLKMPIISEISLDKIPTHLVDKIPYSLVRKELALPIEEREEGVVLALADPLNLSAMEEIAFILDRRMSAIYVDEKEILKAIHHAYHQDEGATSKFLANLTEKADRMIKNGENGGEEIYDLLENKEEAAVVRLLNLLLAEAIQEEASDIHFEPFEDDLQIRYRIDGVLHLRHAPHKEYQMQLLTRIKVLAKLDIAEQRLPQDGRIKLKMGAKEIDIRVSTIPVTNGERIVLRILDRGNVALGLEELGMMEHTLQEFKRLISLPEGIVLVTGPTGSGKTTTLYSALFDLLNSEVNIMTIEDPVEYKIKGIAQIAIHPKIGLTFASGLRHILRQDPDIVMVGEIRDQETAEIAIQAALTGHLVLSTLHTNDAPSAVTRLMDMGIEPYLLSSTVAGVVAQRLVRRICPACKESYKPTLEEREELGLLDDEPLYRGKGCPHCFQTGYKGRHGIYELMPIGEALQTAIAKRSDGPELRKIAIREKMLSLRQHGAHLVKQGITTLSEILRVAKRG